MPRLETELLTQHPSKKERLMADKENTALIPIQPGALLKLGTGPKNILSVMVSDALALAREREKSLAAARFRIGDYEFRNPDYRQILIWAKALELEPEVFIDKLEHSIEFEVMYEDFMDMDCLLDYVGEFVDIGKTIALEVNDGSIVHLKWNFSLFPIPLVEWVSGLKIKRLGLYLPNSFRVKDGDDEIKIMLRLPSLDSLYCKCMQLTELDLSNVPALTELYCGNNRLRELDLSNIPELTYLSCDENRLTKLNLSNSPALTYLSCSENQISELDLSNSHALAYLSCSENQISELDLSNAPVLNKLECSGNQLSKLDVRYLKNLTFLNFDSSVTFK